MSPPSRALRPSPVVGLIRLRYWAIAFVALTTASLTLALDAALPLTWIAGLLGVALVSNHLLARLTRVDSALLVATALVLDAVLLTFLLALSGGPSNPFSVLYLVLVTLAATLTRPAFTWLVVALSSGGYAVTFFWNVPLPPSLGGHHAMHHMAFSVHLQGMWLAYTLAAVTIALFVSRVSERLRLEREERGRAARLLGLATLAAGAAHEIGNPLGTIRVAASELERELTAGVVEPEHLEDLRLIHREVQRAQGVLERMAIGAGELTGESPVAVELRTLLDQAVAPLGADKTRVEFDLPTSLPSVRWPVHATAQALGQLLRNGLQASSPDHNVSCRATTNAAGIAFEIRDRGSGMEPEVLERLGEPFFTTRGAGMGLGVFIARSLIEHLGGRFAVESAPTKGTTVSVWLPLEVGR